MKMLVITLLLAMNGHILILDGLVSSVQAIPVGAEIAAADGVTHLISLGGSLFAVGVQIAAPVTAAVLVGNVAMGVLARTAPQLQVFMLAYPMQIAIGMFTLAMALPLIAAPVAGWPADYVSLVSRILEAFGTR
jgi:flagellar biosynthetic protein FliR